MVSIGQTVTGAFRLPRLGAMLAGLTVVAAGAMPASAATPVTSSTRSFVRERNGQITMLDIPGARYVVHGINNRGQIVGASVDEKDNVRGFRRDPNGSFVDVEVPGATGLEPGDISDAGQVVGTYFDVKGDFHGFVWRDGEVETFDVEGAEGRTSPAGINNRGQTTGVAITADGVRHGFVRDRDGAVRLLDMPNSGGTDAFKLNDSGQVAGGYLNPEQTVVHGFVWRDGQFTTVDVEGATNGTLAAGINNPGQIVGFFYPDDGVAEGFTGRAHRGALPANDVETVNVPGALYTQLQDVNERGDVLGAFEQPSTSSPTPTPRTLSVSSSDPSPMQRLMPAGRGSRR